MALKKQQSMLDTFSMASMTDVVFLLLVFFMVTSTFIFPTGMEVNLPQSTEQTPLKPTTRIYVLPDNGMAVKYGDDEAIAFDNEADLVNYIRTINEQEPDLTVAIYADTEIAYGRVVDILNLGAANNIRMVLATVPGNGPNAPAAPTNNADNTDNTPSTTQPTVNGQQ